MCQAINSFVRLTPGDHGLEHLALMEMKWEFLEQFEQLGASSLLFFIFYIY